MNDFQPPARRVLEGEVVKPSLVDGLMVTITLDLSGFDEALAKFYALNGEYSVVEDGAPTPQPRHSSQAARPAR